jgi:hypothetical protein
MAGQAASFVAQRLSVATHPLQDTAAQSSDAGSPSNVPDTGGTEPN